MEEVVAADKGADQGEYRCLELGPDLLGGGPVGNCVRVRDVGDDTCIGRVLGGFHHRVAHRMTRRKPW